MFRLVNPFLWKHKMEATDPIRVNKSDAKVPPDHRLLYFNDDYNINDQDITRLSIGPPYP